MLHDRPFTYLEAVADAAAGLLAGCERDPQLRLVSRFRRDEAIDCAFTVLVRAPADRACYGVHHWELLEVRRLLPGARARRAASARQRVIA